MTKLPSSLQRLINELSKLPGIGPKTAQRLAFYLLKLDGIDINNLSQSIAQIKQGIVFCSICHNMGEADPCATCGDPKRDHSIICVVEEPLDAQALDKSGRFNGVFHVLGGVLNPLEGIGPENLEVESLVQRISKSADQKISEVIIATNPSLEGETTSMHLQKVIKAQFPEIKITRIARGLPMGGDLEYADDITLMRAMGRAEGILMNEIGKPVETEYGEKQAPRNVILEVGAGGEFYYYDVGDNFKPDDFYLALDLNPRVKKSAVEASAFVKSGAVVADAQEMPLKDCSVGKLILSDILNAPLEEYKYMEGGISRHMGEDVAKVRTMTTEQIEKAKVLGDPESFKYEIIADNIINEALRVLKYSGELFIVEKLDVAHKISYSRLLMELIQNPDLEYSSDANNEAVFNNSDQINITVHKFIKKPPK